MLDGFQEIEEHICQNGSKYTQMASRRDGHAIKDIFNVVTIRVILRTFVQNFTRECRTVVKKQWNIRKRQMGKNIPKSFMLVTAAVIRLRFKQSSKKVACAWKSKVPGSSLASSYVHK